MSFKDMRTMKAELFFLFLIQYLLGTNFRTRHNNSHEREGGCVTDPRKQKSSGSNTTSIFGSQLTNTESTKTQQQQQQKPVVDSMRYSQENQKNESMDNSEHYSQHKMFQFCLKCNVTLLSLFQYSYLGEGQKEQQKSQCGKTLQSLIYGKAKSTQVNMYVCFYFFNEQTVRYLKVHFDLINMSKSTLYF